MKNTRLCYLFLCLAVGSCITPRSYIMSPMDINSSPYQSLPSTVDSQKAATYASFAFNGGGSNQTLRDGVFGIRAGISRSYQFGSFQAYYGGGINLGNYSMADGYAYRDYRPLNGMNDTSYHYLSSNKFFGSYRVGGGMNLVIPFGNGRGEWRIIGFETSYQREFGDYVRYRKQLPDSVADLVASYNQIFTLGGTTELVGISRHGTEIGYKVAVGAVLFPAGTYRGEDKGFKPYYMSHALHLTKRKVTGFVQFNIGAHAASFQFGMNYNLSRKKQQ